MNCTALQVLVAILSMGYNRREGRFKWTKDIDENCFLNISKRFKEAIRNEPNLLRLNGSFNIVGDVHGSMIDIMSIFSQFGYPPDENYVFLGDYVDRGRNSVEVLMFLQALKVMYPNNVYLLRGNHESDVSRRFGFFAECQLKKLNRFYNKSLSLFNYLSIAVVVNDMYLCMHGGIGNYLHSLSDIENIEKPYNDFDLLPNEILWSDPLKLDNGVQFNNNRGAGFLFGKDILDKFLNDNNLKGLIRAHEFRNLDNMVDFERCYTVFSSSNYTGKNNNGYILKINPNNMTVNKIQSVDDIKNFKPLFPK